jgi:hypothetical protein
MYADIADIHIDKLPPDRIGYPEPFSALLVAAKCISPGTSGWGSALALHIFLVQQLVILG